MPLPLRFFMYFILFCHTKELQNKIQYSNLNQIRLQRASGHEETEIKKKN